MNSWSWLQFDPEPLRLKKGDQLFAQGSQVKRMHIISHGRIKLIRHTMDGDTVILHVATAGEMVAEASFFSSAYHCSAIVDQPSELNCIDRDRALQIMFDKPQTSRKVMQLFVQQIHTLRNLIEVRNIRSAQARILSYLNTIADPDGKIELSMSLRDMAYKLGLAHETLYRELRCLESTGQIDRSIQGVIVLRK